MTLLSLPHLLREDGVSRRILMNTVTGFTIDGASSTDLDDAAWVEADGNNTRLQVHVADVASKVEQDSFLDRQALKRGETAYLPTTRKPLFPHSLEASLSLLPFVERAVLTVDILVDPQGELLDVQLSEGVLVSQEQFSYEAVEGILRGAPYHLQPQLRLLEQVTRQLAQQRQQQGAVYGRTVGTSYIDEDGRVVTQSLRSQQIIAELMILTNRVVSEYMRDHKHAWLYRTHDYRDLNELPAERRQFVQELQAMADDEQLRQALAGHYDRAQYRPEVKPHVGLGLDVYAHTTSPIRRYADLVNQRLLKAALHSQPVPYMTETLTDIATHLTTLQHDKRDQKNARYRAQRQQELVAQVQQTDLSELSPELFSKALKQGVLDVRLELAETASIFRDQGPQASVTMKFETLRSGVFLRYGATERWEISMEVPVLYRSRGFMDGPIQAVERVTTGLSPARNELGQSPYVCLLYTSPSPRD